MKKFLTLFAGAAFLLFAAGCGGQKSKKIKIGLAMESLRGDRWAKDRDAFIAKVESLGGEVVVQVANGDDKVQNEQAENLLTLGVDVLVVIPHNGQTAAAIVESAHRVGKKVIAYDRIIRDCDVDLYISFDNVRVGEVMAGFLVGQVPKGSYFVLNGPSTDYNAILIQKGFHNILDPLVQKGDLSIAMEQPCKDWMAIEALKHTENALTQTGNKVDAILTAYDGLAGGAAQALAEQKLTRKVPITGQDAELDACKRVIDGTQAMTLYKPVKWLGAAAAEAAMGLAKGEALPQATRTINNGKIDVPSILLEPIVVEKSNMEEKVVADGFHTKEEIYGK